jgi:hypothetical protein
MNLGKSLLFGLVAAVVTGFVMQFTDPGTDPLNVPAILGVGGIVAGIHFVLSMGDGAKKNKKD